MAEELNHDWTEKYGLSLTSVQILATIIPEDDAATLKELQKTGAFRSQAMAGATLVQAQAEAMKTAAGNANGAAMGFFGMNMAMQAGGANAADLLSQGAANQQGMMGGQPMGQAGMMQGQAGMMQGQPQQNAFNEVQQPQAPAGDRWFCPNCGNENHGNFCVNCGTKRP